MGTIGKKLNWLLDFQSKAEQLTIKVTQEYLERNLDFEAKYIGNV